MEDRININLKPSGSIRANKVVIGLHDQFSELIHSSLGINISALLGKKLWVPPCGGPIDPLLINVEKILLCAISGITAGI